MSQASQSRPSSPERHRSSQNSPELPCVCKCPPRIGRNSEYINNNNTNNYISNNMITKGQKFNTISQKFNAISQKFNAIC